MQLIVSQFRSNFESFPLRPGAAPSNPGLGRRVLSWQSLIFWGLSLGTFAGRALISGRGVCVCVCVCVCEWGRMRLDKKRGDSFPAPRNSIPRQVPFVQGHGELNCYGDACWGFTSPPAPFFSANWMLEDSIPRQVPSLQVCGELNCAQDGSIPHHHLPSRAARSPPPLTWGIELPHKMIQFPACPPPPQVCGELTCSKQRKHSFTPKFPTPPDLILFTKPLPFSCVGTEMILGPPSPSFRKEIELQ